MNCAWKGLTLVFCFFFFHFLFWLETHISNRFRTHGVQIANAETQFNETRDRKFVFLLYIANVESRFRSVFLTASVCMRVCNCMRVCVIIYCKRISILYKLIVKEIINYWVFLRYRCFYWSIIGAVLVENLSVFSHIFSSIFYFSIVYFAPLSRHVIRY